MDGTAPAAAATRAGRAPAAALGLILLLAGCGSGGSPSGSGSSVSTGSGGVRATSGANPSAEPAPTGTDPQQWIGTAKQRAAVLVTIRVSNHGSYDRLVLQFDQPVAGYLVGYVQTVLADPSGKPVRLRGAAYLRVVIQGATLDNIYQAGPRIPHKQYAGPSTVYPSTHAIRQVTVAGDFESVLTFGLGLKARTGFAVTVLKGPDRLVIDVAHR